MAALFVVAATLSTSSIAHADPVVVVTVRRQGASAEAHVELRSAQGVVGTCQTQHGTCEIHGARAGRHVVVARDTAGRETPAREVMLPENGRVTLIVNVP